MKKILIAVLTLGSLTLTNANAQDPYENMVENGSFEQILGKLKREGGIQAAVGWMSPTKTAADLFSQKAPESIGVPGNVRGYEDPQDGTNYAGIRTFSYGDKEPRNYLTTKLKLPLRKNAKYCVKFYVSLAEASKYASNNVGINFSKKQFNFDEDRSIMTVTSIQHVDNPVFNGLFGWDEVCGIYTAIGGEKFLTIGNFAPNGDTQNERLKKPKDFSGAQIISAYYYIDNVSVLMVDSEDECQCQADERKVETSIIYEEAPLNTEGLKPEQIAQFSACYFGYGASDLTDSDKGHLNNIAAMMVGSTGKLMITAHLDSDEAGDADLSELGMQRAMAAKEYLTTKGVDGSRILTEDKKDTLPKDQSDTELGNAKNRRLSFTYIP